MYSLACTMHIIALQSAIDIRTVLQWNGFVISDGLGGILSGLLTLMV